MEISFRYKKLERLANDERKLIKEYGKQRAYKFKKRIGQLSFAKTLEDVRFLPGRFHELINDRKGQWACDLDQPYRLIFKPHNMPIPTDEHGKFIWIEIIGVNN